jgi:hypothetical protein
MIVFETHPSDMFHVEHKYVAWSLQEFCCEA